MIRRDGFKTSVWQDAVEPYVSIGSVQPGQVFDVIIVGGGITGISTALQLQEAGKKCLVLEAQCLGFGTTGGTTAHLNTYMDSSYTTIEKNFSRAACQQVAGATAAAIARIRDNARRFGIDCGFSDQAAYLFAQDEKEDKQLAEETVSAMNAGLQIRTSETIPVPIPFTSAIKVEGQAKFVPTAYLYGLARAFEEAGGSILQDCRVMDVKGEDGIIVQTALGSFAGDDLVYATHIPPGINLLHLRCAPWRSYAMAVKLADDAYPDGLVYDLKDPYNYYRSQMIDGEQWLIAGGKDHKTGDADNTEKCFLELESHVRSYFNVSEVGYKWSSQYFEPTDGLPYIGLLPGAGDHIYVATGYGGNGIVYSTVAASVIKSLILQQENELAALFAPSRVKPVAGFTNFLSHNAHVAETMVRGWFAGEKIGELASLAPGEARLVKHEGQKLGLYKDFDGGIHAVSSACTHMKCGVSWNQAEQSWDCPCHGARYNMDGEVLTGPADRDLAKVQIGQFSEKP